MLVVLGGTEGQRQLGDLFGRHMYSSRCQHRGFATDTEEANRIKYPVRTPDSVFVYDGPLALTVSRLKVTDTCALVCRTLHHVDVKALLTEIEPIQLRLHSPCIPNHHLHEQC